eukprot:SAG11_NODE_20974_length_434_cov_1.447761_1_plen_97_part_10
MALSPVEAVYFYNRGNTSPPLGKLTQVRTTTPHPPLSFHLPRDPLRRRRRQAAADFGTALERQPGFKEAHLALEQLSQTERPRSSPAGLAATAAAAA